MSDAKDAPTPADPSISPEAGQTSRRATRLATVLVLFLGIPMLALFGFSVSDGYQRAQEGPLRAALGDDRFEALMAGEGGSPHYLGYERIAPDVTFQDRHGNNWSLRDQRGKVVVLNFWSMTCPPCVQEMPSLESLAQMAEERFGDNVEVVAVSTDSGWDAVSTLLPSQPHLHHLFDSDKSEVEGVFGTRLYPETWIIDADGVIRLRFDGARDWASALSLDVIELFL